MAIIKRMLFISKKDGMSAEDFKTYYETKHVPLVASLVPMEKALYYKRNFVDASQTYPRDTKADFDVITEMAWENEANYKAFIKVMFSPEVIAKINADEAKFQRPGSVRTFVVAEEKAPLNRG